MANDQSSNPNDNSQAVAEDALFGSTESFFDALDDNVNGMVSEDSPVENKEATPNVDPPKSTAESGSEAISDDENWKKRYSDSSREAQKMKAELDGLKPYVPVLDAMKQDSGLVEHVRDYIKNGGKDVKDALNLGDDFTFDTEELIDDPSSKSRKVFNAMVDGVVKERTGEMMQEQEMARNKQQQKMAIHQQAEEFRTRNGLSKEQMADFLNKAQDRFSKGGPLSFDDMYSLINRDGVNQNVARATKEDMLTQMKNVRTIPASQGNANNAGEKSSPDDDLFDALKGVDGNLDNMFG
tara:strand:+ start:2557 stop:3444 length:888 start_codon:yes stop_codon:yes gene_type:complete